MSYLHNGNVIGETELVAANEVERDNIMWILHTAAGIITSPFFIGGAVLLAGGGIYFKTKGSNNRRRRPNYKSKYR